MTTAEAMARLNIGMDRLRKYVYLRRLIPEQPISDQRTHTGVGPGGWTFTEAEIERFSLERDASNDRRRIWNGAKPKYLRHPIVAEELSA